jgi:hypothetical protein
LATGSIEVTVLASPWVDLMPSGTTESVESALFVLEAVIAVEPQTMTNLRALARATVPTIALRKRRFRHQR